MRVAFAPLLTDLPIILLAVFLFDRLPPQALRWVGLGGGLVVIWLGVETLRSAKKAGLPTAASAQARPRHELWQGALVNALNPHPYLFWATVGAPALVRGWRISPLHALAYLVPFYTVLVGSKVAVAWLVGRKSGTLSVAWYRRLLFGCGLLMLAMGGFLIGQGILGR